MAINLPRLSLQQIAKTSINLADRSKEAERALPSSKGGETPLQLQNSRTEIYSYFTVPSPVSSLLYSAENWVKITLDLETAGPVAIGTSANIAPVLSGHGVLLDTDVQFTTVIPRGTRVYIVSETVNRVNVTIEPIPWAEQIDSDTVATNNGIRDAVNAMSAIVVATLAQIASALGAQGKASVAPKPETFCPPPQPGVFPRKLLTPITMPKKVR